MSVSYAETRIREALRQSQGNEAKAHHLLVKWSQSDHRLLYELMRPHMGWTISYAVSRVIQKNAGGKGGAESPAMPVDDNEMDFGKELLKNFAMGQPVKFAQESFAAPLKKRKASQKHIDAIMRLAKKP